MCGINFRGIVVVNNNAALSVRWTTPSLWERSGCANYGSQRRRALEPETIVTAVFLLLASLIVGLATGLYFRVWALLLISPLLAIVAAVVLQTSDFGLWTGVPIVVACLVVSQMAYLLTTLVLYRGELSIQDQVDGAPGKRGERDVADQGE